MTPMTSSAASLTDRARKRVPGTSVPTPASTARPPPSGMWTSSSTTSGFDVRIRVMASATVSASPTRSTASPSSARTPDRNSRWSSTSTTRGRSDPSATGHLQLHLGALAGRTAHLYRPAVALHPPDDRLGQPEPVRLDRRRVEADAAIPDVDRDPLVLDLGVDPDLVGARVLGRVDHCLPRRRNQRDQPRFGGAVTDDDHLDRRPVRLL